MAALAGNGGTIPWRLIGWGGAAMLLALPLVAMQFTSEVKWDETDFIVMGAMLATVGGLFELAVRLSRDWNYRAAFGLALLGGFLVIWANLAVGIVGSEDNPANLWFFAALLVAVVGSAIARLRPNGMAATMAVTAAALAIAFALAAGGGSDEPFVPRLRELKATTVLAGVFVVSSLLFARSARAQSSSSS